MDIQSVISPLLKIDYFQSLILILIHTALILHGGGLVLGSKAIVPKPQISYLTKAGFLVVVPNYRLCPQVSAFEGPITDSKDCLIWAIKHAASLLEQEADGYRVDSEKVVVMGHSAGGGLALNMVRPPHFVPLFLTDFFHCSRTSQAFQSKSQLYWTFTEPSTSGMNRGTGNRIHGSRVELRTGMKSTPIAFSMVDRSQLRTRIWGPTCLRLEMRGLPVSSRGEGG